MYPTAEGRKTAHAPHLRRPVREKQIANLIVVESEWHDFLWADLRAFPPSVRTSWSTGYATTQPSYKPYALPLLHAWPIM